MLYGVCEALMQACHYIKVWVAYMDVTLKSVIGFQGAGLSQSEKPGVMHPAV